MKKGIFKIVVVVFLILQVVFITFLVQLPTSTMNTVAINEIVQYTQQNWNEKRFDMKPLQNIKYTIIDNENRVLYQSNKTTSKTMRDAHLNQDTIIDIMIDEEVVGKILLLNETEVYLEQWKYTLIRFYVLGLLSMFAMILIYYWYIKKLIFTPFYQLTSFAIRVANGNFDIPLPMDRYHVFGAFTESFDLMREELKKAKEEETKAKQEKRELVAKLSHDIKTPVASIKALSELMRVQTTSSKAQNQLDTINKKADQIDQLISDLFHATLEELQQLPVYPIEMFSEEVACIVSSADYLEKANQVEIAQCLIIADPLRLQQVIDNIINNSYKYADTKINISAYIKDVHLVIDIMDYGQEAQFLNADMLCEKFFRDKNAYGKSGAGLGLFISKYLIEQMQGSLQCEVNQEGFCVHLYLKLAN